MRITVLFALAAAILLSAQQAWPEHARAPLDPSKLPPPAEKKDLTYATNIKPLFDKACVRCHADGKAKANLRLNNLANALHGGEHGKVILPGDSASSRLVLDVAYLGPRDKHMPPPGNKAGIAPLTKEEVGLIRAWIDQGAK